MLNVFLLDRLAQAEAIGICSRRCRRDLPVMGVLRTCHARFICMKITLAWQQKLTVRPFSCHGWAP